MSVDKKAQSAKNWTLGKSSTTYSAEYDPSLLVAMSREPRRKTWQFSMQGYDHWTAYEFSFLLKSGLPSMHVLWIQIPQDSPSFVESKSLKLYLNSFNNTKFSSFDYARLTVARDLTAILGKRVVVREVSSFCPLSVPLSLSWSGRYDRNGYVYDYDKSLLRLRPYTGSDRVFNFATDVLRSNCEITKQPDWATVLIHMNNPKHDPDRQSLFEYIVSYRNHCEFHEPTCERIFQDLTERYRPDYLSVECRYTRRGGIDINPFRETYRPRAMPRTVPTARLLDGGTMQRTRHQ